MRRRLMTEKLAEFATSTSSHGYERVVNSNNVPQRIIWTVLLCAAVCVLNWHLYYITNEFLEYNKNVIIQVKNAKVNFPKLVICQPNSWSSYLISEDENHTFHSVRKTIFNMSFPYFQNEKETNVFTQEVMLESTVDGKLPLQNFINSLDTWMLDCNYQFQTCNSSFFSKVLSDSFGTCYRFNTPTDHQTAFHKKSGLKLLFYVEDNNDIKDFPEHISNSKGLLIYIMDEDIHMNFNRRLPTLVSTGTYSSIGVRYSFLKRTITPVSTCTNRLEVFDTWNKGNESFNYNTEDCTDAKINDELYSQCDCVNAFMPVKPRFKNALHCGKFVLDSDGNIKNLPEMMSQRKCVKNLTNFYSLHQNRLEQCDDACSETYLVTTSSSTSLPTQSLEMKQVSDIISEHYRAQVARGQLSSLPSILINNNTQLRDANVLKENLLRVHIYVSSTEVINYKEQRSVSDMTFISNVGGVIGFWVGASVLTVFEFLQLFVQIISLVVGRKRSACGTENGNNLNMAATNGTEIRD